MTDCEVRAALLQMAHAITTQAQAITAQANMEVVSRDNQHASTMASLLRDFMRINPLMFFGSKDKAQTWYNQWKDSRSLGGGPMTLEISKKAFIYRFFPREQRESSRRLMVHAQPVEDSRLRKKNREAKKSGSLESGASNSRIDIQDKPKFKKRFSTQVTSNFSKNRNDRGSNPKPQRGRNVNPPKERPICGKCVKKHIGESPVGTNSCYDFGKGSHMVKDCSNVRSQVKGNDKTQPSGPNYEAPKMNRFYELKSRGEQENSTDVVTVRGFLEVFPNDLPEVPPEWEIDFRIDYYRIRIPFQFLHIGWL
ncbi:uncharacterized protein LOC107019612 [Solanum pennellii]|uniref:Uncharacterized protein LOC107019612 n=1 Tax=Solanum pennellii TaxID=28526 RepID=A0ABM1GSY3_SOLPN|nr:uncharacterized protein LOC107019612 [Solanum pennellii]